MALAEILFVTSRRTRPYNGALQTNFKSSISLSLLRKTKVFRFHAGCCSLQKQASAGALRFCARVLALLLYGAYSGSQ
jgi:hypothetical protein